MDEPKIIGLERVILICKETKLFDDYGRLVREPDILAYDLEVGWVIAEYKSSVKHKNGAVNQLVTAAHHLSAHDIPELNNPRKIYVSGNFKTEVVK